MKKILGFLLVFVVGLGFGYLVFHSPTTSTKTPTEKKAGAQVQNDTFNFTGGLNAGSTNQYAIDGSGNVTTSGSISAATFKSATVGSSSSSPAALGSAASGHFVLAAAATTANASTTAVTANSDIQVQQELVTPIAGTTCNTAIASGTVVSLITASNGFQIKTQIAPTTNPFCYSYSINN